MLRFELGTGGRYIVNDTSVPVHFHLRSMPAWPSGRVLCLQNQIWQHFDFYRNLICSFLWSQWILRPQIRIPLTVLAHSLRAKPTFRVMYDQEEMKCGVKSLGFKPQPIYLPLELPPLVQESKLKHFLLKSKQRRHEKILCSRCELLDFVFLHFRYFLVRKYFCLPSASPVCNHLGQLML